MSQTKAWILLGRTWWSTRWFRIVLLPIRSFCFTTFDISTNWTPGRNINNENGMSVQSLTFEKSLVSHTWILLENNQKAEQTFYACSQLGSHHCGPEIYLRKNKQHVFSFPLVITDKSPQCQRNSLFCGFRFGSTFLDTSSFSVREVKEEQLSFSFRRWVITTTINLRKKSQSARTLSRPEL